MNPKSLENLKKGKDTQFRGDNAAMYAERANNAKRQKNSLKELASLMLSAKIDVDEKTLAAVKRMGFDVDKPQLQMIGLVRLGSMLSSKNPAEVISAMNELREMTGQDTKSMIEAERRQLERERLAFEREKLEFERMQQITNKESNNGKIDELIAGLKEIKKEVSEPNNDTNNGTNNDNGNE